MKLTIIVLLSLLRPRGINKAARYKAKIKVKTRAAMDYNRLVDY